MQIHRISSPDFKGTIDYKSKEVKQGINYAKSHCRPEDDTLNRHFINTLNFIKNDGTDNVLTLTKDSKDKDTVRIASYYGDKFVASYVYDNDNAQNYYAIIDAGYELFGEDNIVNTDVYPPKSKLAKTFSKVIAKESYIDHLDDDIRDYEKDIKDLKSKLKNYQSSLKKINTMKAHAIADRNELSQSYTDQMKPLVAEACKKS